MNKTISAKNLPVLEKNCEVSDEKIVDMPERKFYNEYRCVIAKAETRKLPLHSCRHTTATALAELNTPPAIIQEILGHTDYNTTMQYTHINRQAMIDAVNRMDTTVTAGQ